MFLRHLVEQERSLNRLVCDGGQWHWLPGPLVSPSLVDLVRLEIGAAPGDLCEVVDLVAVAEPSTGPV